MEKAQLGELLKKERHRFAPEAALVQEAFVAQRAKRLSERTGLSEPEARKTIERQCAGILHPDVELPFDDPELAGCTVRDVLASPERFVGATLADPVEGVWRSTRIDFRHAVAEPRHPGPSVGNYALLR